MPRRNKRGVGPVARKDNVRSMIQKKCKSYFIIGLVPGRKLGSWFQAMGGTDVYCIWGQGTLKEKGDLMILRIPSRGITQPIPKADIEFTRACQRKLKRH